MLLQVLVVDTKLQATLVLSLSPHQYRATIFDRN